MNQLTLEKAKELCKDIKGLNGAAVLIGEVSPLISDTGLILKEEQHKDKQKEINHKGLLIVSCEEHTDFKEGDRVTIIPESYPLYTTIITSSELLDNIPEELIVQFKNNTGRFKDMNDAQKSAYYKKYTVWVFHPISFAAKVG